MKKLLTLTIAIILLALPMGCDENEPYEPCEPTCGIVDRMGFASNDAIGIYEIYVKNDCSNKIKKFRISKTEYHSYKKGDFICTVDGSTWKEVPIKKSTIPTFKLK